MSGYALPLSADEIRRLRIQGDMVRDDADRVLTEAGLARDARCLDLCCGVGGITDLLAQHVPDGQVVGLDYDGSKLAAARSWAAELALDIEYVEGDGFNPPFAPESFDLVHIRFALGIIADGPKMLAAAANLLKPGGLLFAQEAVASPYGVWPPLPEVDRGVQLMMEGVEAMGSDLSYGLKLGAQFADVGIVETRLNPTVHIVPAGAPMMEHLPLTLIALRSLLEEKGLIMSAEFDPLIAKIRAHLATPGTTLLSFTLIQAIGRKP
ncbi:MAG: methyltransferase domain-containing protein [Pseudomonadota bacterium]